MIDVTIKQDARDEIMSYLDTDGEDIRYQDSIGFCCECGFAQHGVEPDAAGYQCVNCSEHRVAGIEVILLSL